MKLLFCTLLLGSLTSCSHEEPTPTSTLTGDKWTLQTESTLSTPQDGTSASTSEYPVTDKVTLTFLDDMRFSLDVRNTAKSGHHFESLYTYQGQALTFPRIYSWNTDFIVPQTLQVTELSAHKLVTERHWKNIDIGDGYYTPTNYVTTDTYTR